MAQLTQFNERDPIDTVTPNTAVAELGEGLTTAKAAKSAVPPVPTEVHIWSCQSESFSSEETIKPDNILDDIAVFFATSPRPPLVCDCTSRSTVSSLDHNQKLLAVANFCPGSYPSLQQNDDKKLFLAVSPRRTNSQITSWKASTISPCQRRSNPRDGKAKSEAKPSRTPSLSSSSQSGKCGGL